MVSVRKGSEKDKAEGGGNALSREQEQALLALIQPLNLKGIRSCPRGQALRLIDPERRKNGGIVKVSCRCYRCPPCRDRRLYAAALHGGRKILACGKPLFVSPSPDDTWEADRRRLSRAGVSRFRVQGPSKGATLIGTAALVGGVAVSPEDAVCAFVEALQRVKAIEVPRGKGNRLRPVNASEDWSGPKRDKTTLRLLYHVRHQDVSKIVDILGSYGVKAKPKKGNGITAVWSIGCTWPADFASDEMAALEHDLAFALATSMSELANVPVSLLWGEGGRRLTGTFASPSGDTGIDSNGGVTGGAGAEDTSSPSQTQPERSGALAGQPEPHAPPNNSGLLKSEANPDRLTLNAHEAALLAQAQRAGVLTLAPDVPLGSLAIVAWERWCQSEGKPARIVETRLEAA